MNTREVTVHPPFLFRRMEDWQPSFRTATQLLLPVPRVGSVASPPPPRDRPDRARSPPSIGLVASSWSGWFEVPPCFPVPRRTQKLRSAVAALLAEAPTSHSGVSRRPCAP